MVNCGATQESSTHGFKFICDHQKDHPEEFHTDTMMHHTWYPVGTWIDLKHTIERAGGLSMPDIFQRNHFNGKDPCDMLIGPCACGATHSAGEWELTRVTPNDCPTTHGAL